MGKVKFVERRRTCCQWCCYDLFSPECLELGKECNSGYNGYYIEDKVEVKKCQSQKKIQ